MKYNTDMSMTFTKLFSSITESTVWCEDSDTRVVWVTMLAMADKNGRVFGSVPGLAKNAVVSLEACIIALDKFKSPDEWSRTQDNEGRRIEEIDGGWRLLNHGKYRSLRDEEERKAYKADWIRNKRASVDNVDTSRPQATYAEAEAEAEAYTENINTEAWSLYVAHRKELKAKRLTPRGVKMAMNKLAALSLADQMKCVETTIANGWTGLFPEKVKNETHHNRSFDAKLKTLREKAGLDETAQGVVPAGGDVR